MSLKRAEQLIIKTLIVVPLLVFSFASKNYWSVSAQEKSPQKAAAIKKSASLPKVNSTAESGVKLLIGILQRIGNVPQLAMQQSSNLAPPPPPAAEAVSNQIFGQNLTDPALAIRPQMRRQSASQSLPTTTMGRAINKAKVSDSNLIASSTKLYQISKTIDELDRAANSYDSAPVPKGVVISNSPRITEYGAASGSGGGGQAKNESSLKTIVGAIREAQAEQMSRMTPAESSDAYAGDSLRESPKQQTRSRVIKLDQPSYYKHIREYDEKKSNKDFDKVVAYNPPSMVFGIAGLQLGASNNDVSSYIKSQFGNDKNKFKTMKYKEWQVWSLVESGSQGERTTLQIFSRANQVEALRIFDDRYIPDPVNVRLADTMAVMKNRFGEPAFVLEEPQPKDKSSQDRKVIKNYVYPVSQVSFQLVRGDSGASPVVTSILLFKFL